MILTSNCAPTLIFIGFSLVQILIDIYKGIFNQAFIKFIVMIIFSIILNILCDLGYRVIAWFIVFIPIIMMTIISTLLLKVFGTNPDEEKLRSQIKNKNEEIDKNSNLENSDNYLAGANLLNQQKSPNFNTKLNLDKRIDRNTHRRQFYDKVENVYNLGSPPNHLYDLSNNPIKYNIVDKLINFFGENMLTYNISSFLNIHYPFKNSNLSYYSDEKKRNKLYSNYDIKFDKIPNTVFQSYEKKYNEKYLLDGQLLFKQYKYKTTKENHPDLNDTIINVLINNEWDDLTIDQQVKWNNSAKNNYANNNSN